MSGISGRTEEKCMEGGSKRREEGGRGNSGSAGKEDEVRGRVCACT